MQPIDYGIHYITSGPPGKQFSIDLPKWYHEGLTWKLKEKPDPKHLKFVAKLIGVGQGIFPTHSEIWVFKMIKAGTTSFTATKGWLKKRKYIINIKKDIE